MRHGSPFVQALLLSTALACGPSESSPGPDSTRTVQARSRLDPLQRQVCEALEAGLLEVAEELLEQLDPRQDVFNRLLAARAALLGGDSVAALRLVEEARQRAPEDDRVVATAVELYAALGRTDAAAEELREGWKIAGKSAALERARGLLALVQPGGAAQGLEALGRARELDPGLPFCDFPLSQGHLLVGRALVGEDPGNALVHAREALGYAPGDLDAKELRADALAALGEFDGALEVYAELDEQGRDTRSTRASLHHRAATACLLERNQEQAVDHYQAARRLGLSDEELGFGLTVLARAASGELDRGIEAYQAGELEQALGAFERARALQPDDPIAQNHLGVVLFRLERYAEAAEAWEVVWSGQLAAGGESPEPVHLNLARALHLSGQSDRAAEVARRYLDEMPEGAWRGETEELLGRLP